MEKQVVKPNKKVDGSATVLQKGRKNMIENGKNLDQKKRQDDSDQTMRDTIPNPGGWSVIEIGELTKGIPPAWYFKSIPTKVAAAKLGMSVRQMRNFCRDLPDGNEWFGNGYQLNRWRVEAMARLLKHYASRQLTINDFLERKSDGTDKK